MKPTKDDYNKLADILGDALDNRDGVGLYGDNLFTAYKALRLVVNMPSEEEIVAEIYKACGEASTPGNSTYACLGHIAVYGVRRAFANAWTGGKEINLP